MKLIVVAVLNIYFVLRVTLCSAGTQCDSVYTLKNSQPQYRRDNFELTNYLNREIIPIITKFAVHDEDRIASLFIVFTIDSRGHVAGVAFPRPAMSNELRNALRKKLLTMKGWKPGTINGKPVCSYFKFPVSCLKWE